MDTLPGVKENKFLSPEPEKKFMNSTLSVATFLFAFHFSLTYKVTIFV